MVPEAARPGGPLSHDRWFLSSLSMHDFLLAAMIIYLNLFQGIPDVNATQLTKEQQVQIRALETSRKVWSDDSFLVSAETKRAAMVLGIMLNKVNSRTGAGQPSINAPSLSNGGRSGDELSRLSLHGRNLQD